VNYDSIGIKNIFQSPFIVFILSALVLPFVNVHADTGPHPTMRLNLQYNVDPVRVTEGKLYSCDDTDCSSPEEVPGPFFCNDTMCSYAYGGNTYYKLVIIFSDGIIRESNVFEKKRFNTNYLVEVNQKDLLVTEKWNAVPYDFGTQAIKFVVALILTIPTELLVGSIFFKRKKQAFPLLSIVKANLISLPFVWFVFPFLPLSGFVVFFSSELFALLIETWYFQRNIEGTTYTSAFWLSLSMNFASALLTLWPLSGSY